MQDAARIEKAGVSSAKADDIVIVFSSARPTSSRTTASLMKVNSRPAFPPDDPDGRRGWSLELGREEI